MPNELSIFISSKMQELADERQLLRELIPTLGSPTLPLKAWVYENDAPASSDSIRKVYLKALEEVWLYIGIFWHDYGEWTIDEFEKATEWGIPRLIFVKNVEAKKRDPRLTDFLNKNEVATRIAPKWFTTDDELKTFVTEAITLELRNRLLRRVSLSAMLITDPDDMLELPHQFVGRASLIEQAQSALTTQKRLVLQGFGGMGKTALAAHLVSLQFATKPTAKILWMQIGADTAEALYEGLARPFNKQQDFAKMPNNEIRRQNLRQLIRQSDIDLVVLDDAWNGTALHEIAQAIPHQTPLMVTSRTRMPLDGNRTLSVAQLDPAEALELLSNHWGQTALEIAGKTLATLNLTPTELWQQIKDAPHDLNMPADFAAEGRENIKALIDVSINALGDEAKSVFLAFGAMFAPSATSELLALFFIGTPEVTAEQIAYARPQLPEEIRDKLSDEEVTQIIINSFYKNELPQVTPTIENALHELQTRGLANRIPETEDAVAHYRVHDLAYSYARVQMPPQQFTQALHDCLNYTHRYNESSLNNFKALRPELDSFLTAAQWAFEQEYYAEVEDFAITLYAQSQFLTYRGFYTQALILLQHAARSAAQQGNRHNQGAHLGNLGNAFFSLGQYEKAIEHHTQALTISREIGDKAGEGNRLGNLGLVYRNLGQYEKAIEHHTQALNISSEIGNKPAIGSNLGNLGNAYFSLGQYHKAIDYFTQALTVSRKSAVGLILGSLGSAYSSLGQFHKAIDYYAQALTVSREIGDKAGEGNGLGGLGIAYASLGQYEKAIEYHKQAFTIRREIGDKAGEGNGLGNLGNAYFSLMQYTTAIDYHTQALTISREIGNKSAVGSILGNLGNAYVRLGQYSKAIEYHRQALTISREIGNRAGEGNACNNIAVVHEVQVNYKESLVWYNKAFVIYREIGQNHKVERVVGRIANIKRMMAGDTGE